MPWWLTLIISIAIIAASAFFVMLEFSLLAARRSRLEEEAEHSGGARSALRAQNQLTMMLAAAQLGITGATFALGAITKPAVKELLSPVFYALGLPDAVAYAISFALALFIVTFLHLVVGEMVPKSWAIAHPETAAKAAAPLGNGMVAVLRPLLTWINHIANRLVKVTGVEPVDRAAAGGYDATTLSNLVEHSTQVGVLDKEAGHRIRALIELGQTTVGDIAAGHADRVIVMPDSATVADIQKAAQRSGHFRVLMQPAPGEKYAYRYVHVRDTLLAEPDAPASAMASEVMRLPENTTVSEAVELLRAASRLMAVVVPAEGEPRILGVITTEDLMDKLWPSLNSRHKAGLRPTASASVASAAAAKAPGSKNGKA